MRIKKVSQTTTTQAQISDGYSESKIDGYSCDYVNGLNTYSTTEKRIGTWIDGKPLYRKVIEKTSGISTGSNAISHGISDLKELVSTSGYYVRADNKQGTIPRISDQSAWMVYFGDISSTTINLNVGSKYVNTFALSKVYVILEYTKTSD